VILVHHAKTTPGQLREHGGTQWSEKEKERHKNGALFVMEMKSYFLGAL
jgi:hypothetical protein